MSLARQSIRRACRRLDSAERFSCVLAPRGDQRREISCFPAATRLAFTPAARLACLVLCPPFGRPVARGHKSRSPESAFRVNRSIHHVGGFGVEYALKLAGPPARAAGRPGGLVRVRGPVR